ncbi:MAG: hypothetical protein LQ337_000178 [Flavoplaca oasis]|nr:MAG: hypothetical protein LQ337_000178 [Flavoplaca oasis]
MPSADPPSDVSSTFTAKPFSISFGASKTKSSKPNTSQSTPSKHLTPKKRPHSSLNDDSDSDPNHTVQRNPQLVSTFDRSAGGAIPLNGNEKAKEPLVIQPLQNRNWREESRRKRGKNLLPAEIQAQRSAQANGVHSSGGEVERDEVGKVSGLSFVHREDDGGVVMQEEIGENQAQDQAKPKTADEEAMEALLGGQTSKSTLIVPAVATDDEGHTKQQQTLGMSEEDHFRSDVSSRPDSASLDDYARVPVEEFGLGMLRGMGWKEGETVGKRKDQASKPRVVERRPALLGIGAKEVPGGVGDELGAWGKEVRGKRKVDKMYNPVLLKNSKTGEMLTEEELQAKKEKHKEAEKEWRDRRDRNLAIDKEKKSDRKRQQWERDYEDGPSRSGRRERSKSPESRRSSSPRERSRSPGRKHDSSRRERSKSRERRHHSRRRDYDEDEPRHKARRREREKERDDSRSSSYSHRLRDDASRRQRD